jgi:shikimate 5-dehydrogenase
MYFIGVTTRQSSINQVFPRWAERLGLGDCELHGMDFPLHDRRENYRAAVDFIKRDPLSLGALVTTHKIDLCNACADQFDAIEPLSRSLGEISSIYKRGGELHGRSVDPWNAGYALEAFLPKEHWRGGAEALILGAGGAGTALAWHLSVGSAEKSVRPGTDSTGSPQAVAGPRRILMTDRFEHRLAHVRRLRGAWASTVPLECHLVTQPEDADALLARLPRGSLVVNATGMGKDTPGSPLSDGAVFPQEGVVWEFNYRGNLVFLDQARAQQKSRVLRIEDGWTYFLHGWTRVISDVFDREIPPRGALFDDLGKIAAAVR